ncbi:hypothetical protein C4577_06435 [Candidatus Parcubacteria bacterium]|nr:MAG: hypothetical protein C4577_06435 [Candidatus Parcubacteria bacterium]
MKKSEMAVAIAKDVLKWIPKYKDIGHSRYMQGDITCLKDKEDSQAQKHTKEIVKNCGVCALGACFVSYINVFNKLKISDIIDDCGGYFEGDPLTIDLEREGLIKDKLLKAFSQTQLDLIEAAFERDDLTIDWQDSTSSSMEEAIEFGERYNDSRERLRAIMKNIIKNNGKFVPNAKKTKKLAISQ